MTWQRAAIRDDRLTAPAVAVVAALVVVSPGRPRKDRPAVEAMDFYGSVPSIMKLSRLCERSVRGALAELQRAGYLLQVKRGGWRNNRAEASTWRLTAPPEYAPNADSEPVENPAEEPPNLHERLSEPAPEAVPRAEVNQERSSSSVHMPGTEGADMDANDDDAFLREIGLGDVLDRGVTA